ncbi:MAG: NAD-dependent epimerase/dehydratase family protein [Planctomycetia bacterium]|nr:NAD-dependent epimerase/dehydratase family protein [Planctomycetia bacterium]
MNKTDKIFITGATGFIGTTLVRQLLRDGYFVRGMSRFEPKLPPGFEGTSDELWDHPNFEYVQGDVTDLESTRRGMNGCRFVIHMAGYAKNYAKDSKIYEQININGMRNVFIAAKEQKIEKIVWTSTIVTLGPTRRKEIGDENMPRITTKYYTEYEETKSIAEKEAFRWIEQGLPLVIVNPTRVYGPGQLSEGNALAQLIDDYRQGRAPFLLNAGINIGNYVLVDDVAKGHFLALEKGKIGERYILGSENASLGEFYRMIDKVTGQKHWKIPVFRPGALIFATIQKFWAKCFGTYPRITPGWVRTFLVDWAFSCDKAKRELGYDPVPLEEGLKRTCLWLDRIKSQKM